MGTAARSIFQLLAEIGQQNSDQPVACTNRGRSLLGAFRSAVSAIPSLTGTRREATSCTAKNQCRSVLRPLRASAGDSSEGSGATMPATAAAPDETRSERLAAVRNLELALDPEAAAAAELRRRHKEAVELARTGDPEMALACLHSLLVSVCASVTCAVRAVVQQQSIGT